jgi:hypothetical protein
MNVASVTVPQQSRCWRLDARSGTTMNVAKVAMTREQLHGKLAWLVAQNIYKTRELALEDYVLQLDANACKFSNIERMDRWWQCFTAGMSHGLSSGVSADLADNALSLAASRGYLPEPVALAANDDFETSDGASRAS